MSLLKKVGRDPGADSGAEKRELCLAVGAEKFLDFKESTDLIADVKTLTDPLGAHVALITTHAVSPRTMIGFPSVCNLE